MVGVAAAVLLGAVFVVSGAAKLAAPGWPAQAAALRVPGWASRPLPVVELAVGAGLVAQLARQTLAAVALVLLGAFSAVVVANLAAGRRPVCACFGRWSARPIGAGTLVRNAVLAVVAVVAMVA